MRAAENNPPGLRPYDYVMITLVAFNDPGLVILPTHRLIRHLPAEAMTAFAARVSETFAVEHISDAQALRDALAARGRGTLAIALKGDSAMRLLRLRDHHALAAALPGVPAQVRDLDVSILHALILDRIFGIKPEHVRAGGMVEYTIDARAALAAVAAGGADGAFLMNPPAVTDVERVCDAGATMPEKSTYFHPKLLTGLLMNPLE
jgi:uncharacterized protein (DUF1015 family)